MGVFGSAKVLGRTTGCISEELQPVAHGADGATAVAGYLGYGHPLNAIETEDRQNGGRFGRALEIEAIEQVPGRTNRGISEVIAR